MTTEKTMKLRRSTSESKVDKERRNEERAMRARSVHFGYDDATVPTTFDSQKGNV